ncbi:Gamma-glutamylputrescine oxidoreductase [Pelagimonas phthalicica]|uniref:Gamma-glutamylputrescine oxidoreductase n=1 Tax=Pelagimonas phthalicica TaxID=1037362 RepID=A0A238J7K5_9RHOB|nr:FAD-binding oxidoreductase [Pelagimonas phthalicica]TDS95111.1 glycine/D-amino acid oxidase-like deaminating enzyme [Pelagimonas phthalicica]SMX26365.1 Gamma-glutamylputrescine oxidoreductase [Pelagimonas phthalicica]
MTKDIAESLWHETATQSITAPALAGQVAADLVVIGGGYTGLSAALHAAEAGLSVRLLEAGVIGGGGSGRNVGLVNAGLWLPPDKITAKLGKEPGEKLIKLLGQAPDLVFGVIDRHDMACEPVRNGTLHCAHAPSGMADLENRYAQASARNAPVQLLGAEETRARVGSDTVFGGLFDPRAGTIQPLAYARGLALAAQAGGAVLHENSAALSIAKTGAGWQVKTAQGEVTAQHMIVATNAYTLPISGLPSPKTIPVHYFQAATAPLSATEQAQILPGREGCWDTALVMSSWRMDAAGRLIIGAMGQLDHPGAGVHLAWLRRKLAKLFPALAEKPLTHTWFGRIAMTEEYMPKILQPDPSALICFGYSGRGIGPGTVFGKAMAEALITQDVTVLPRAPSADHNITFPGLRQVYYETGATLTHLVKDRV